MGREEGHRRVSRQGRRGGGAGRWGTHRSHVICPLAVAGLQPLHGVKVINDPHRIAHPEGVVLRERERPVRGTPRQVWLPWAMEQEAPPLNRQT